jgi:hypothetical protein
LGYGVVYYNAQVTANVLSFFNMAKKLKSLVYDNNKKDAFIVTREDGSTFEFIPSSEGLYYYDFNNSVKRQTLLEKNKHTMVIDTVDELKRNFTKREIERADITRRMYVTLGRPSQDVFESIIRKGSIINNPVAITDYRNALNIYGKNLGSIKGKTTRTKPQHVQFESSSFPERKKDIVLLVDIMHFTGINFLITVSRDIKFITAGVLSDRRKITIYKSIKQVLNLYKGKGHMVEKMDFTEFNNPVHTILADNEFESLREK